MVIIAIFGGLFMGGAVLAILKRVREPAEARAKRMHIVRLWRRKDWGNRTLRDIIPQLFVPCFLIG